MELKDFIKETLINIIEGIKQAQGLAKDEGATIVPADIRSANIEKPRLVHGNFAMHLEYVEFEVVLSETMQNSNEKGIGVLFGAIGAGGKNKTSSDGSAVTSIKFQVPIVYPVQQS